MADYFGYWAQLLVVMAQALEVLIMVPLPIEVASGFLFGPWASIYSILGLALGSMLAFLLGRWFMKKYIIRLVNPETMKLIRRIIRREGTLAAFLLFLLPGIPKDFLCYLFGVTRMSLPFFLAATTLARLPGTILLNAQGAQVYKGHYPFIPIFWVLYVGLGLILYWRRESFYLWVSRRFLEDN